MKYCLDFSLRVEDVKLRLLEERGQERDCTIDYLTADDEEELAVRASYECDAREGQGPDLGFK